MGELRARLAKLREIRDRRLIRLDHLPTAATEATAAEAATLGGILALRSQRHGQIRADARKRIQSLGLGLVQTTR